MSASGRTVLTTFGPIPVAPPHFSPLGCHPQNRTQLWVLSDLWETLAFHLPAHLCVCLPCLWGPLSKGSETCILLLWSPDHKLCWEEEVRWPRPLPGYGSPCDKG